MVPRHKMRRRVLIKRALEKKSFQSAQLKWDCLGKCFLSFNCPGTLRPLQPKSQRPGSSLNWHQNLALFLWCRCAECKLWSHWGLPQGSRKTLMRPGNMLQGQIPWKGTARPMGKKVKPKLPWRLEDVGTLGHLLRKVSGNEWREPWERDTGAGPCKPARAYMMPSCAPDVRHRVSEFNVFSVAFGLVFPCLCQVFCQWNEKRN